jgi:hypothetical protein
MNRRESLTVAAAIGAHGAWGFRSPRPSRSAWQDRRDLYPEGVASGDAGPVQVAEAFTHLAFPAHFRVELAWAKLLGAVLLRPPPQFPNVSHAAVRYQTDGPRRVPLRRRKRSQTCNFVIDHRHRLLPCAMSRRRSIASGRRRAEPRPDTVWSDLSQRRYRGHLRTRSEETSHADLDSRRARF